MPESRHGPGPLLLQGIPFPGGLQVGERGETRSPDLPLVSRPQFPRPLPVRPLQTPGAQGLDSLRRAALADGAGPPVGVLDPAEDGLGDLAAALAGLGTGQAQARTTRRNITQMEMRLREDMRHLREDMRQDTVQLCGEVRDLRQHVDTQIGDLRDRMGRIEGYLDLLREFFLGSGRGTAA